MKSCLFPFFLLLWAAGVLAFDWNVPQALQWTEVGDQLQANGMPLKIFVARSKWKTVDVLLHYQKRFADEGFYVPAVPLELKGLKMPRVTALDTQSMWSYLVYAWPEPDGTTTLVMGAADLKGRKIGKPLAGGFPAPLFPGAKASFSSNVEFARTLSFSTPSSETEVMDFYRQTLPAGGWTEREPGNFVREGRLLRLVAKAEGKALRVVLVEEADLPPLKKPVSP